MPQQDALQSILAQTGVALSPLRTINSQERAVTFFRQLGYDFSPAAFGAALPELASAAGSMASAVQSLATASSGEEVAGGVANLLRYIAEMAAKISQLHGQLQANAPAVPNLSDLPRRLTDFLLLDFLDHQNQTTHEVLLLLGMIEHNPIPEGGVPVRRINWERIPDFLSNPGKIADDVYQWNSNFDTTRFLERLERVLRAFTLPGGMYQQSEATRTAVGNATAGLPELRMPIFQKGLSPETYAQFGINVTPAEAKNGKKKGFALMPYLLGAAEFTFTVCDRGELLFQSSADLTGIGLVIRPPFEAEGILSLAGSFQSVITIREKPSQAEEHILIGSGGGSRLSVQGLGASWFIRNTSGAIDIGMEGDIQALRFVINGGEGDGFLAQILSGLNVQAEANLGFGISLLNGFTFRAGGKLALELTTHIELGPISIEGLRFEIGPTADYIKLDAGAVFKFDLGPLKAVVENIGLSTALHFRQGNIGPADLEFSFKPPNGVGLSIDAGVVKGGGYLFFDFDREEYAGVLQLDISGFVTITAIGMITTRMPDGSKGFSLLVIMSVEFSPGIQLGFGFTFLGIGGLLGLNRTAKLEVLAQGIRSGILNNIMFPQGDIIANAPRIISDLRSIFPPEEGKFLVGPMVKIGWGTPTLISISVGVIIEIPGNFAIVGIFKVAIPTVEAPLIIIQVAFIGAVEFDKKRLWFFASMFDSRVVFITLEGEMGLLIGWGDDASFVVSVGGFHPRFNPPPLPFPNPRRIAIDVYRTPVSLVRLEGYFAVTSNTVQLGAHVQIRFGVDDFGIEGHFGFDALFQFSPFYFILEISASVSLKVFGIGLFSIRLEFSLEGPSPYRAKGTGYLSILFFEISADFDVTWGEAKDTILPPIAVLPLLTAELDKLDNWKADLPANNRLGVSLRQLDEAKDALVLHPLGVLRVSQRLLPLNLTIDKLGNQKPSDAKRFELQATTSGMGKKGDAQEQFAMAQFQKMSDSEKVSRPSFQKQPSGLELSVSGNQLRTSHMARRTVRYEEIIIDSNFKRFVRKFRAIFGLLFSHLLNGNAVSRLEVSQAHQSKVKPFGDAVIKVAGDQYTVAFSDTNQPFSTTSMAFGSEALAREFMDKQVAETPALMNTLHVIPQFEANIQTEVV